MKSFTTNQPLTLTVEQRFDDILRTPKLSFANISVDNTYEYMNYSAVITIPCGYYAVQINIGNSSVKMRRGYHQGQVLIDWDDWIQVL